MRTLIAAAVFAMSCTTPPTTSHPAPTIEKPVMTGVLQRSIVESIPAWRSEAEIDVDAAHKLAAVAPGASVTAIIGTWCSDSRREVPRLWKALDVAGTVPWTLEVIGVDRDKRAPGFDIAVAYVPTFIVTRDGKELGRIIESAPAGIERDLLSLLDGTKTGVISGRTDVK